MVAVLILIRDTVFLNPTAIPITADYLNLTLQFANGMSVEGQSCEYYAKNRNTDPSRARENIITSKLAECATADTLPSRFGFPKIKPNFDLQAPKKKGWDPDLSYSNGYPGVHVKSTARDYGRGLSWTFQYKNVSRRRDEGIDRLFSAIKDFDPERFFQTRIGTTGIRDMVACVHVPPHNRTAYLMAFVSWKSIVEKGLLKDPIRREFVGLKMCLYYNDLAAAYGTV